MAGCLLLIAISPTTWCYRNCDTIEANDCPGLSQWIFWRYEGDECQDEDAPDLYAVGWLRRERSDHLDRHAGRWRLTLTRYGRQWWITADAYSYRESTVDPEMRSRRIFAHLAHWGWRP